MPCYHAYLTTPPCIVLSVVRKLSRGVMVSLSNACAIFVFSCRSFTMNASTRNCEIIEVLKNKATDALIFIVPKCLKKMNYATSPAVKLTCVPSYGYHTLSRSLQMRHGVHRRWRPALDALCEDVDGEGRGALHARDTRLSHKHVRAIRRRWIVVHHQEVDTSNEAGGLIGCLILSVCHCNNWEGEAVVA